MRDVARITQLSTSHFCRAFKTSFGETPRAYILRRRVERAQELMLTTKEPLSQIALACGLCDQAHFSRVFRRIVGETHNAWRRQCGGTSPSGVRAWKVGLDQSMAADANAENLELDKAA